MNEPSASSPAGPQPQPTPDPIHELQLAYAGLKTQMIGILIVLLTLGLGLNIFLLRQVGMARKQSAEMEQFIGAYAKGGVPQLNEFLGKLREFSKSNPDFAPILNKYFAPPGRTNISPAPLSPNSSMP